MVGRDETVEALVSRVMEHRFVSIVGPGGMGKTTVAVAAAHVLANHFGEGVCFIDVGAHSDPSHVATAVASALGFTGQGQDPLPGLLKFLGDKPTLLVLDNCEHLIDAVAGLTERLFSEAAQLHILTTTREALRVEGENIHFLLPLASPHDEAEVTAAEALSWPAVQLFMERASASGHRAALNDVDARTVSMICRRLDGIALAIELAAGRVGAYGIRGTADLLDNRFKLLWQGRRSALPRHQTMQATLDWSYNLLSDREKQTLTRLSVFVGAFTVEDAVSVVADDEGEANAVEVAHALASLINKSLVWASEHDGHVFHRLLDTTRSYAAVRLAGSGEEQAVARRHALHFARLLKSEPVRVSGFENLSQSRFSPRMGNLRAALQWSFSENGDLRIGVDLASQSAPLFLGFSLLGECEHWCERGLSALDDSDRGTVRELALLEASAISSMFTRGNTDAVRQGIERGLALAEALKSTHYQCHLLAGLNIFLIRVSDFRTALSYAERSVAVAAEDRDPAGSIMAEWSLGVTHHLVGNQEAAQRHCEIGLELARASGLVNIDFFGYDHRVRALLALARALWLRGLIERSLAVAQEAIDIAAHRENPVNICISLIYTIPIYIWVGEYARAEELVDRLIGQAAKNSLGPYHAVGLGLLGRYWCTRAKQKKASGSSEGQSRRFERSGTISP
jgi:predicted ATPase